MLKGVNKKVVEVMDIDNEYFEKAILFIKAEKQERDERTIKEKATSYLKDIRYTPRAPVTTATVLLGMLKFAAAAMVGAVIASMLA